MATLSRSTSTTYKDYMSFLENYKKNENGSSTPVASDVTDFSKNSAMSFNAYIENLKKKKFSTVEPNLDSKNSSPIDFSKNLESKPADFSKKKSEIFVEIQPAKPVSEVSKIFEKNKPPKSAKINSKIHIFEKQTSLEKPKLAEKPTFIKVETEIKKAPGVSPPPPPPPVTNISPPKQETPPPMVDIAPSRPQIPPPPPPMLDAVPARQQVPPPPPPMMNAAPLRQEMPPPPPPMRLALPTMQATLVKGPQIKHSVSNPDGVIPTEIDRNNPVVKKLVYGTLRGLYGAYHEKANDIMATLPKNMVKKSNGVQDIIEKIASNGDLEKLNGRVNPKQDQELSSNKV